VDEQQDIIHGEVSGIHDVVTFKARRSKKSFRRSTIPWTDYLAFCAERSESPLKPSSGKFLVGTLRLVESKQTTRTSSR